MSLVRSVDLAPTSYKNAKLFSLKGTDVRPGLSSQIFGPDKHRSMDMADSYSSESYEKYFHDCQTEELIEPSNSSISGSSIPPDVASSYQLTASSEASVVANNPFDCSFMSTMHHDGYQSNFGSDLMDNGSLDSRKTDGLMSLKLQALERALLDDSEAEEEELEEEDIFEAVQSMEIDPDLAAKTLCPSLVKKLAHSTSYTLCPSHSRYSAFFLSVLRSSSLYSVLLHRLFSLSRVLSLFSPAQHWTFSFWTILDVILLDSTGLSFGQCLFRNLIDLECLGFRRFLGFCIETGIAPGG